MGKPERDRALSPVNPGDSSTRQEVYPEQPPTITWPDQVAPQGPTTCSTGNLEPQYSNLDLQLAIAQRMRRS